jgi:hypothetical protein
MFLMPSLVVEPALMYVLYIVVVFIIFLGVCLYKIQYLGREALVIVIACINMGNIQYESVPTYPTSPLLWTWWQQVTCKGSESFSSWIFVRIYLKAKDGNVATNRSWVCNLLNPKRCLAHSCNQGCYLPINFPVKYSICRNNLTKLLSVINVIFTIRSTAIFVLGGWSFAVDLPVLVVVRD